MDTKTNLEEVGVRTWVPACHCLALLIHPFSPTTPSTPTHPLIKAETGDGSKQSDRGEHGPQVAVGTVPAGTELVRARKRRGQSSSHQRASCAEIAGGGKGQERGQMQDRSPKLAVSYSHLGLPTHTAPMLSLRPL